MNKFKPLSWWFVHKFTVLMHLYCDSWVCVPATVDTAVCILLLLPLALQPTVGIGLSNNVLPFFPHLPPTLSIFSLQALEDLFVLPLSILSWVFPFFLSLPVLEWRSFWASYPPPFSLGDLTSLSFALLSILLYFLLCSSLLVPSETVHLNSCN